MNMSNKWYKKKRTRDLINKAVEKNSLEYSGDAVIEGYPPYYVCSEKMERFVDFIIKEHTASVFEAIKNAR